MESGLAEVDCDQIEVIGVCKVWLKTDDKILKMKPMEIDRHRNNNDFVKVKMLIQKPIYNYLFTDLLIYML